MICPFLMGDTIRQGQSWKRLLHDCVKENCALWDSRTETCALSSLSRVLEECCFKLVEKK